ncbi:MAG: hypothetical protein ACI8RD_008509 [Bacillariaceae sp.]|jgi:hypothetical protein
MTDSSNLQICTICLICLFLVYCRYYIELKGQPGSPREVVENDLSNFVKIVLDRLLEPEKNGLKKVV